MTISAEQFLELVAIKDAHERLLAYLADYGYSDIQNSRELVEVYGLEPRKS